jgi:pimeloyl-ACP methyl ester carboxylesterase
MYLLSRHKLIVLTFLLGLAPGLWADFLPIDDDRIYYEDSGAGFPVVLVAGGSGMGVWQWGPVRDRLSGAFRVLTYEPRGIGNSDNPTSRYSDAQDLTLLLDHLGLDDVALIGLSSSGGFVLEFALRNPERVSGVVASAAFVPGFEFRPSMQTRIERFAKTAQQGREPFLDSMFDDAFFIPAPLNRSVREQARAEMGRNYDKGAGFDRNLPIPLEPPLIEQLNGIESPVLLLAGELDHPEVLRRNRFLASQIPATNESIISNAGHNPQLENPDEFVASSVPFLTELAVQSTISAYHDSLISGDGMGARATISGEFTMFNGNFSDDPAQWQAHNYMSGEALNAWPSDFVKFAGPYKNQYSFVSTHIRGDAALVVTMETGSNKFRAWEDEKVVYTLGRNAGEWKITSLFIRDIKNQE